MRITLLIHVAAGSVAIVAGYVALAAAKGAGVHRKSGVVFVWSMVTMALFAAWLGAAKGETGNVTGGLLTAYLAVTALTTVRPPSTALRRVEIGAMLVPLVVAVVGITVPVRSLAAGNATIDGVPAPMYLLFGIVALLAFAGDVRMMRAGGLRGSRRIARHLWRMCFAMWVATGSFFLGQADELPEPLRIFPLLAVLAVFPLLAMAYWLWRVRAGRAFRGLAGIRESVAVPGGTPRPAAARP